MSDTHNDKDKIIRVNYAEIVASVLTSTMLTPMPMATPLLFAIQKSLSTLLKSSDLKKSKPTDAENLHKLIEAGKEQGVSEMKIELEKSIAAGINLGGVLEDVNVDITIGVKTENRVVLDVKYK